MMTQGALGVKAPASHKLHTVLQVSWWLHTLSCTTLHAELVLCTLKRQRPPCEQSPVVLPFNSLELQISFLSWDLVEKALQYGRSSQTVSRHSPVFLK